MSRVTVPWHRWRFSLPLAVYAVLFGWLAWDALARPAEPQRLLNGMMFGGLAVLFAWVLWCDRQPIRFRHAWQERERLRQTDEDRTHE